MPTPTLADSLTSATAALADASGTLAAQAVAIALREANAVKASGQAPDPNSPMELAQALALGSRFEAVAGGSVNALAVRLPAGIVWPALLKGMRFALPTLGPNTGSVTVQVAGFAVPPAVAANSGLPAGTLQVLGKKGGQLASGDLTGADVWVRYDGAGALRFSELSSSELVSAITGDGLYFELAGPAAGTLTPPSGYTALEGFVFGGGGGGGGSIGGGQSGSSGGGGGGRDFKRWTSLTTASAIPYSIPGQAAGGAAGGNGGAAGGTTTLGTVSATGGGGGSYGTNALGGLAGSGSGGDYPRTGTPGGPSIGTVTAGGSGGSAPFGGGSGSAGGMGVAGGLGGGGGGGAGSANASAGAPGGAGLILYRWKR